MNKFVLELDATSKGKAQKLLGEKLDEILGLNRRFQTLRIGYTSETEPLLRIIANHGSHLRKMQLWHVRLNCPEEFRQMLSFSPLLATLQIGDLRFDKMIKETTWRIEPAKLPSLQNAKIGNSDTELFRCFTAAKLLSLELGEFTNGLENLVGFLKSTDKLESLSVYDWAAMRTFQDDSRQQSFMLKKLSMGLDLEDQDAEGFINFLASQAASLESLEIRSVPREVLKMIFSHPGNLKILIFADDEIPDDEEFYENLKPIEGLKELNFRFSANSNEISVKGILTCCPNIERLSAPQLEDVSELLPFIAINNPKLKRLAIKVIESELGSEWNFKFLTHLEVEIVEDLSLDMKFIANNPSIESFVANHVEPESMEFEDFDELLNQPNLKHLKIGGPFEAMKEIYEATKCGYGNLVSLELEVHAERKLFFKFPHDGSQWNPNCHYFDMGPFRNDVIT